MNNLINTIEDEKIQYSKVLSSLFCSVSILALSILCLLNNLSFDIYSAVVLIKIVTPGCICFWIIGFLIGKILDGFNHRIEQKKIIEEKKAYEIPSMFLDESTEEETETGELWKK